MEIIKKQPNKRAVISNEEMTLENMQSLVGGYIEPVYLNDGVILWCNEEGKYNGSKPNIALTNPKDNSILDVVFGDIFITRDDIDGEVAELGDEQKEYYLEKLNNNFVIARICGIMDLLPAVPVES